jgi:hypothetical protein
MCQSLLEQPRIARWHSATGRDLEGILDDAAAARIEVLLPWPHDLDVGGPHGIDGVGLDRLLPQTPHQLRSPPPLAVVPTA